MFFFNSLFISLLKLTKALNDTDEAMETELKYDSIFKSLFDSKWKIANKILNKNLHDGSKNSLINEDSNLEGSIFKDSIDSPLKSIDLQSKPINSSLKMKNVKKSAKKIVEFKKRTESIKKGLIDILREQFEQEYDFKGESFDQFKKNFEDFLNLFDFEKLINESKKEPVSEKLIEECKKEQTRF